MPRHLFSSSLLAIIMLGLCSGLLAQQRTFVSGAGNDSNPCSINQPCRTFQRAVTVVTAGGEVVALDSAGYGALVINKSVSITAPDGFYAGITVVGGANAVRIEAAGAKVYLKGLTIVGPGLTGGSGVQLVQGESLFIDRCRLRGFNRAVESHASSLTVKNTIISEASIGVEAISGSALVEDCTFDRNSSGINVHDADARVRETNLVGCGNGISALSPNARVVVVGCLIQRGTFGVVAASGGTVTVAESVIVGNETALFVNTLSGSQILTRDSLSNTVVGNMGGESFTGTYEGQ